MTHPPHTPQSTSAETPRDKTAHVKSALADAGRATLQETVDLVHEPRTRRVGLKTAMGVSAAAVGFMVFVLGGLPETSRAKAEAAAPHADRAAPDTVHAAAPLDLTRHDLALTQNSNLGRTVSVKLKSGQALGPLLQKQGLSGGQAYKVTQAFAESFNPRDLRAGQKFTLNFNDDTPDSLQSITLKPSVERTIIVNRNAAGDYVSRDITAEFKQDTVRVTGTIAASLYLDAQKLGAPDRVIDQFSKIYQHGVDFQRDIRTGDAFEMTFIVKRDHQGKVIKSGDLLHTSFSPRGKTSEYYLFTDSAGHENYYDANGKSAKRMLIRTPVSGARLSSRFGKRRHPVLGYAKMHKGVDFAAPRGTPIVAAGSGKVLRANRYGSFGNYIKIRHSDGYQTAYAHLKSFARGVKSGAYVTQGQVIGYVGTTGRSTGPHLHYEVHKNGRAINPSTLSTLSGKPLAKKDKAAFNTRRREIDAVRAEAGPVAVRVGSQTVMNAGLDTLNP